jgi:HlyD family secretion protein
MQVEANVDEADIGQVHMGQKVTFNVDAYPDNSFTGEVTQIRLNPTTVSNVVTYTVIIKAPNTDNKLMPGMTANISIISEVAENVLSIPSKALRFTPDSALMESYMKTIPESDRPSKEDLKRKKIQIAGNQEQKDNHVWVKKGNKVFPVPIKTGISDETNVQIIKGLTDGEEVIISMSNASGSDNSGGKKQSSSPFMPKRPGGSKK